MDELPALDDRLTRIQAQCQADEKSCALIDRTIELLDKAKDNLSTSYVGKVEQGFEAYASSLLGSQLGHIRVDKDLNLHIDALGEARPLGSFSAGMADSIMLCMRLALIDALFTKEKPFLILDDPFVNLDDDHTRRALDILNKLSQEHQIIYLVCNSSRK